MTDKPESDQSGSNDEKDSSTIFDSDISDDWGEAFESEDFMYAPDEEAGSEFFLDDDDFDESVEDDAASPAEEQAAPGAVEEAITGPSFVTLLLDKIKPQVSTAQERFSALPKLYKAAAIALIVLLAIPVFLFIKPSKPPEEIPPAGQTIEQKQAPLENLSATQNIPQQISQPPPSSLDEKLKKKDWMVEDEKSIAIEEKVRKKWRLPSFLISADDNGTAENTAFVAVDLTFILLLNENEALPRDKTVYLRDIVYQFYTNRPLYELRRYSLARGEMNRKLKTWIEKEWPEAPLVSIVFDRYQVL